MYITSNNKLPSRTVLSRKQIIIAFILNIIRIGKINLLNIKERRPFKFHQGGRPSQYPPPFTIVYANDEAIKESLYFKLRITRNNYISTLIY